MYASNGKGSVIRLFAGIVIILSLILSKLVSPNWLIVTGLVGVLLIVSALTGICLGASFFRAFGITDRK